MAKLTNLGSSQGTFRLPHRLTMTPEEIFEYSTVPIDFKRLRIYPTPSKELQHSTSHDGMLLGDLPLRIQLELWKAHKAARQLDYTQGTT